MRVLKIFRDGRCMFPSLVVHNNQQRLICERDKFGYPLDSECALLEEQLADVLRHDTVDVMGYFEHYYNDLPSGVLEALLEHKEGQFYPLFFDRCYNMMHNDTYAGTAELMAVVFAVKCHVEVYEIIVNFLVFKES